MALDIVDASARAGALLHPIRQQILGALREPASASSVARLIGLPRQKVNYHLRELEKAGFIEEVEQRRAGNCIERIVRAKATHYLLDPHLLGNLGADPNAIEDRFSSTYLIALAAQVIRDVSNGQTKARSLDRTLATFTLSGDVTFASASDRKEFTQALSNAFAELVARYQSKQGRTFRFLIGAYPTENRHE